MYISATIAILLGFVLATIASAAVVAAFIIGGQISFGPPPSGHRLSSG